MTGWAVCAELRGHPDPPGGTTNNPKLGNGQSGGSLYGQAEKDASKIVQKGIVHPAPPQNESLIP